MRIESHRDPNASIQRHEADRAPARTEAASRTEAKARVRDIVSPKECQLAEFPRAKAAEPRSVLQAIGDFFTSVFGALTAAVVGSALSFVSHVQEVLGLEPRGESLPPSVLERARKIFGNSIDFSKVKVKWGSAGVFSLSERAFVLGNTLYMKGSPRRGSEILMLHELTHIWQNQHRGPLPLGEAAMQQIAGTLTASTERAYDWKAAVARGLPFERMNPECQAELIQDAVAEGYFDKPANCRSFVQNGIDYTHVIERALREIRNAP
jgi:hypothetical protein